MPLIAATSGFDYDTGSEAAVEASGKQSGGPANTGVCDMQYDRLGFPIPSDFEPAVPRGRRGSTRLASDQRDRFADAEPSAVPDRGRAAGPLKRLVLLVALGAVVVPALVWPFVGPLAREAVVQWSLERAAVREARGDVASAVAEVGRAIDWLDATDAQGRCRLHCWRANLLLESRQTAAAIVEAGRAAALVPNSALPRRTRALAHVVAGDAQAALADAQAAVDLSGGENPEALNHRAYIRALVGRDLDAALADIERALEGSGDSPEFLDTRGFILHLLGRHREAIDDLNQAIGKTQQARRQVAGLAGRADPDEVAYRLRALDHALAVMHHHRGLACRAIGLERQAAQDFEVAERKGFDPARGVL